MNGKRVVVWGSIVGALMAIFGGVAALFAALDLPPPLPAFRHHVIEVAGQAKQNALSILYIQRSGLQQQIWALEDRIEARRAKGLDVRDARDRLRDMNSQMDDLDRAILKMEKAQ